MAVTPAQVVEPITRVPLPFGLLSVLNPRPDTAGRWQSGIVWEPLTCSPASGIGDVDCEASETAGVTVAPGLPKQFAPPGGTDEATPFTIYGSYICSPTGHPVEWAQDRAIEHLLAREEARAEQAIWTGDLGNIPNFTQAVNSASAAQAPRAAIAEAEQYLATEYGSLGVIHMSRQVALLALAEEALEVRGTRLFTRLGTPVVAGAGYPGTHPDGVTAGTWIVATPAIMGYRSEIFAATSRTGDLLDRGVNNLHGIAERTYVIAWDECPAPIAIQVELVVV